MFAKIVIPRKLADKLWAMGMADSEFGKGASPDEVVVGVSSDVLSDAIDLFGGETLVEGLTRLIELRVSEQS